jgi:hypothetical protein
MKVRRTCRSTSRSQLTLSLDAHDHRRRSRNHHNHHRSQYCEGNTSQVVRGFPRTLFILYPGLLVVVSIHVSLILLLVLCLPFVGCHSPTFHRRALLGELWTPIHSFFVKLSLVLCLWMIHILLALG